MKSTPVTGVLMALGAGVVLVSPACTPAPSASTTYQALAGAGKPVYSSACAMCHGNNGQPADKYTVLLWGPGSTLGSYHGISLFTDAQRMLTYISQKMPLATPGSLTGQQYTDLLAYILVQADKVSASAVYDQSKLGSISIP